MEFPDELDTKSRSLVTALAFRFAKNKPGLEQEDLINEALIKFEEIKTCYDPDRTSQASFSTVFYGAVRNHFLNLQNRYIRDLTAAGEEITEIESRATEALQTSTEEHLNFLRTKLVEPTSKILLDKLIASACEKTTIKDICAELDISFFKYQQAEFKIRHAIKNLTA